MRALATSHRHYYAPRLGRLGKKGFGSFPCFPEKFRMAVGIEGRFIFPNGKGEEHLRLIFVLPKFEVVAAFPLADGAFHFLKKLKETGDFFFPESHFDQAF